VAAVPAEERMDAGDASHRARDRHGLRQCPCGEFEHAALTVEDWWGDRQRARESADLAEHDAMQRHLDGDPDMREPPR
jgi:hypothetical protein